MACYYFQCIVLKFELNKLISFSNSLKELARYAENKPPDEPVYDRGQKPDRQRTLADVPVFRRHSQGG